MVKLTGPALSLDASGSLRKAITFQRNRSGPILVRHHRPGGRAPFVTSQVILSQRTKVAALVAQWQALSAAEKAEWDENAERKGIRGTGYHLYIATAEAEGVQDFWTLKYDPTVLPTEASPGWIREVSGSPVEELEVGKLRLKAPVEAQDAIYYTRGDPAFDKNTGYTIEIAVKVDSFPAALADDGPVMFEFEHDLDYLFFVVGTAGFSLYYNDNGAQGHGTYEMVTTDQEHTYRIVVTGSEAKVFVDGELRLTVTESPEQQGGGELVSWGDFGALQEPGESESHWGHLYFCTTGAHEP